MVKGIGTPSILQNAMSRNTNGATDESSAVEQVRTIRSELRHRGMEKVQHDSYNVGDTREYAVVLGRPEDDGVKGDLLTAIVTQEGEDGFSLCSGERTGDFGDEWDVTTFESEHKTLDGALDAAEGVLGGDH